MLFEYCGFKNFTRSYFKWSLFESAYSDLTYARDTLINGLTEAHNISHGACYGGFLPTKKFHFICHIVISLSCLCTVDVEVTSCDPLNTYLIITSD